MVIMKNMQYELKQLEKLLRKQAKIVGILLDTKGPEIRTHKMENDAIELILVKQLIFR